MSHPHPQGRISETQLRVRYAETDAMGIVHHSRYIPWFELGRSDWLRQAGLAYPDFVALGYYLTVVEVGARYLKPAVYDELITVRTWMEEMHSRGLRIAYEVVNAAGETLVTGFTRHICITHDGRPARMPEALTTLA
ncbi:MAG: acyl-CoA thioesterase [Caldilineales bacterium]|nr:acyl-CoA thioesterase [Caldilineales bacterium]